MASMRHNRASQHNDLEESKRVACVPAAGAVQARHAFVDMSRVQVAASNWTRAGATCPPAMGFSFAAGTTDGAPPWDPPHRSQKTLKK